MIRFIVGNKKQSMEKQALFLHPRLNGTANGPHIELPDSETDFGKPLIQSLADVRDNGPSKSVRTDNTPHYR